MLAGALSPSTSLTYGRGLCALSPNATPKPLAGPCLACALGQGHLVVATFTTYCCWVECRCSLEQMLEEGYYHSDPHPGNLFKMQNGKLAYIDFGMMGEIQGSIRR